MGNFFSNFKHDCNIFYYYYFDNNSDCTDTNSDSEPDTQIFIEEEIENAAYKSFFNKNKKPTKNYIYMSDLPNINSLYDVNFKIKD